MRAAETCLAAGAQGITVHPRSDARHIRRTDVAELAAWLQRRRGTPHPHAELNIEGDPRRDWLDLVLSVRPDQCTLVPVAPGEITSQAGWPPGAASEELAAIIGHLRSSGVRVSLFVDPSVEAVHWAASLMADRVELYTEPFARAFASGAAAGRESFARYVATAEAAHAAGLGINAGHDLDLDNLTLFRELPHLTEVSIGHALMSHALWVGLDRAVRDYLAVLGGAPGPSNGPASPAARTV